jgi:hypothetical protein
MGTGQKVKVSFVHWTCKFLVISAVTRHIWSWSYDEASTQIRSWDDPLYFICFRSCLMWFTSNVVVNVGSWSVCKGRIEEHNPKISIEIFYEINQWCYCKALEKNFTNFLREVVWDINFFYGCFFAWKNSPVNTKHIDTRIETGELYFSYSQLYGML